MSLVSVVVPAFNASRTIRACVESVRRQSFRDYEIIVVDDGSSDGTAEIAASIEGVTLIRRPNGGPASARNAGIARASGKWLAFLDADDEWLDGEKLALQLDCAERFGAALVGESGRRGVERELPFARLLVGNPFVTSCVLAWREAVLKAGGFEEGRAHSEDYLLWLTMTTQGGRAALAGSLGARDLGGRANYARGGLSGDLAAMEGGELRNFRELYRKRLLGKGAAANFFSFLLASICSILKYFKRIAIRAARELRRTT